MKNAFAALVLAVALAAPPVSAADWELLDPGAGRRFLDLHFHDAVRGVGVGPAAFIALTPDAGDTWVVVDVPLDPAIDLWSVDFADELSGIAVGDQGAVLVTDDGGSSWTARDAGVTVGLQAVAMPTPIRAVAVGQWGTILTTSDAGQTWVERAGADAHGLSAVAMLDADTGFCGGNFELLRTSDGGETWVDVARPMANAWIFDIAFRDQLHGRAVGDFETILRTSDGGQSWVLEHAIGDDAPACLVVAHADSLNAVAGGVFREGEERTNLLRTTDGGATWVPESVPGPGGRTIRAAHYRDGVLIVQCDDGLYRLRDPRVPGRQRSMSAFKARH